VFAIALLAVAVGLSNFAAAIGIGVSGVSRRTRVRVAVVFGVFEAGMPVAGLVLGHSLAAGLGQAARWLGAAALVIVGAAGLRQAWRSRRRESGLRSGVGEGGVGGVGVGGSGVGGSGVGGSGVGGSGVGGSGSGGGEGARSWRTGRVLVSGLALSGDNLAAGFVLGAYRTPLAVAAVVFGLVSVAMSLAGLELGARLGIVTGDRSELMASAMLIAVGVAIAAGAF
jgi:manganese efflux pump family protein